MLLLAVKAILILSAGNLLALLLRRRSAAERHWLWVMVFGLLLALPLLERRAPVVAVLQAPPAVAASLPIEIPATTPTAAQAGIDLPRLVWIAGTLAVLAYQLMGAILLGIRFRRARPATSAGRWRGVRVEESDLCLTPMTWGIVKPRVMLPLDARHWSKERRRMVLLHEMMHVKRHDCLTQWLANLACALYWWNPLLWLAAKAMQREREKACDDAVLRKGDTAVRYTRHLLELARGMSPASVLGMASQLDVRIRAALDPAVSRQTLTRRAGLALTALAMVAILPIAGLHVAAQANGGRLRGSVLDASGAAIPSATVLVSAQGGARQEIARSGPDGRYEFAVLPAGSYAVEVRAPGFALYRGAATVEAGRDTEENLSLLVGRIQETVNVVGKKPSTIAAAAPVNSGPPQRVRVGGNIQATKILKMTKPSYPDSLQALGVEGTVLLEGVVGVDGRLLSLRSLNLLVHPDLTKAALDAVSQWQYQPTLLNGQPVEVITTITVNFRLAE